MRLGQILLCALLGIALVGAPGCNGDGGGDGQLSTLSGRAVLGSLAGAAISVRAVHDTGAVGAELGTTTTNSEGRYSIDLTHVGPVVVIATGGTYVDEATGQTRDYEGRLLSMAVMPADTSPVTACLTVPTTLATQRAQLLAQDPDTGARIALENAVAMFEDFYGVSDLLTTDPADLTAGPVAAGNAAEHGALVAGYSQLALNLGLPIEVLVEGLLRDGTDGTFDGDFFGTDVVLMLPDDPALGLEAGGVDLIAAIVDFLDGARNQSGLDPGDIDALLAIDGHLVPTNQGVLFQYAALAERPFVEYQEGFAAPVGQPAPVGFSGRLGVGFEVLFGDVPATVNFEGDERIEVEAPVSATAGTVDITIRNPATGTYIVLEQAFEYFVPGSVPVVDELRPGNGPVAGGTLLEVHGSGFDLDARVLVDSTPVEVVERHGRSVLVARMPAGTGNVQVAVAQDTVASNSRTFAYLEQGAGLDVTTGDAAGSWRLYSLGHGQDPVLGSFFLGQISDVELDASGEGTATSEQFVTSPTVPAGQLMTPTIPVSGRVFPDGTFWLAGTLPGEDEERTFKTHLTDDVDVFAGGTPDSEIDKQLLIGVRRSSGMNDADLQGTYWVGVWGHSYDDDGSGRDVFAAFGTAHFDGAGRGSAGFVSEDREVENDVDVEKMPGWFTFRYDVANDGTFTLTFDAVPGLDVPTEPVRGSLTRNGDLGVGLQFDDEGDTSLLVMVPRTFGAVRQTHAGSWYGGMLGYEPFEDDGVVNEYRSEDVRLLVDGRSEMLGKSLVGWTRDRPDGTRVVEEDVFDGTPYVSPAGRVGSTLDVRGALGASRRFQLALFTTFEAAPGLDPEEALQLGLVLRKPAVYSTHSLAGEFHFVGLDRMYLAPGIPLSFRETTQSAYGQLALDPDAEVGHGRAGAAGEIANRLVKVVERTSEGGLAGGVGEAPRRFGAYAVFGDGHAILSLFDVENGETFGIAEDLLENVVGDVAPTGDFALMRSLVRDSQPAARIVLGKKATSAPPLDGDYLLGGFSFGYVEGEGNALNALLGVTFNDTDDDWGGDMWYVVLNEFGGGGQDSDLVGGSFSVDTDGGVSLPDLNALGFVLPDSSGVFLVDLSDVEPSSTLFLGLQVPTAPVLTAGPWRLSSWLHEYEEIAIGEPQPVPALLETSTGPLTIGDLVDTGLLGVERSNERGTLLADLSLPRDLSLAVNPDGSLVLPIDDDGLLITYRGLVSQRGRFGLLVPSDVIDGDVFPNDTEQLFFFRR